MRFSGALAVLFIVIAAAFPQVNRVSQAAIGAGLALVQGYETAPSSYGPSPDYGLPAAVRAAVEPSSLLTEVLPLPSPTVRAVTPTPNPPSDRPAIGAAQSAQAQKGAVTKHIGLQAGHWKYAEAPAPFNTMTGTSGGGKTEPEVTLAIAEEVARLLRASGHTVDILPTVIPRGYKADLFVAIHADGSNNLGARGFFTDHPDASPVAAAEARLSAAIDFAYGKATGIPYVNRSTPGSHYYYGYREVSSTVPRVLIETGFLTNATDREIIVSQPKRAAQGIADGIAAYLSH
ncbi:MAG: N-acetylmuramoyl-L-alanine amidase [Chloroflexi bacterium]|nr:N-acetylmuramoyl-L-alanine amidase [Chloroflexota bacterium]